MSNEPQPSTGQQLDRDTLPLLETEGEVSHIKLMKMAFVVEGGLAALALVVAYFGFFDWAQPLNALDAGQWRAGFIWGGIGTIPLLIYLAAYHLFAFRLFQPMREFVDRQLKPLFRQCSMVEFAVIALLAGFCEELFFRWCLQGGITSVTQSFVVGLLIASVIFGLCHWVNASYGVTTVLIGIYLGGLMVWTGTWLAPAIAHALFDFVALIYIGRFEVNVGQSVPD